MVQWRVWRLEAGLFGGRLEMGLFLLLVVDLVVLERLEGLEEVVSLRKIVYLQVLALPG